MCHEHNIFKPISKHIKVKISQMLQLISTANIAQYPDKILVPDTQDISSNSNNNLLTENMILEETNLEQSTHEETNVNHDDILNEIKSFKIFQAEVGIYN